jgi:hypothetical protein
MAVAVALRLDDNSARRVVAMWERLYVAGLDPALLLPGSEPEVTLAAYPDDVPTGRIDAALDHLSDSWTAVRIGVTGIGIFGGLSPIVHLAVAPTTALLSYHNQLYKALADHPCDTRYRPGAWTPGIPVSAATVSVAESVRCLLPYLTEPLTATLVRAS